MRQMIVLEAVTGTGGHQFAVLPDPQPCQFEPWLQRADLPAGGFQLLQQLPTRPTMTREQFMAAFPPIRLNALENYVRGILATTRCTR